VGENIRVLLAFAGHQPSAGAPLDAAPTARIVGRTRLGAGCVLRAYATLRGDGQAIEAGDRCWFGAHSTVHIVHHTVPTRIGADVTVGPRALVHAATVGDGAVVCERAVLLDGAEIGAGAAIAPDTLVPPGKRLPGGALYAGVPAARVRALAPGELEALAAGQRRLDPGEPPRTAAPRIVAPAGALVCDTVHVEGSLSLGAGASVWFGTRVVAPRGAVVVGARSNVQDNSTLLVDDGGTIELGERVTVGHHVTLEACRVLDGALVANGARLGRGTVVEAGACVAASAVTDPGSIVPAGMLWAGRPARPLRPLTPEQRRRFGEIPDVYGDEYRPHYLPRS
jgi:carbonic anhydrase/acetyltransferase-like protein (isoleucine patch superfamily)